MHSLAMTANAAPKPKGKRRPPRALSHAKRIAERCFPWKYGNAYESAFMAVRSEMPSNGRTNTLPDLNQDRAHVFLSAAELRVGVWSLYQPNLAELLTNRPLCPPPGLPVLDGHPMLAGRSLPSSSGTVELAKSLRIAHPLTSDDRDADVIARTGIETDFWPLTSDQVPLLMDHDELRAVNLYVKKRRADVPVSGRGANLLRLDRFYYAEANIPTVVVTEEDLHPVATNNLVRLARLGRLPEGIPVERLAAALLYMQERLYHSTPRTWQRAMRENFGLLYEDFFGLFHYGVFVRQLRVDLAHPVHMDQRHRPERVNLAADFANRFLEPMR